MLHVSLVNQSQTMELNLISYQGGRDEINQIVFKERGRGECIMETSSIAQDIVPRLLKLHIKVIREGGAALVIKTNHQKTSCPVRLSAESDDDRVSYQIKIYDTWHSLTQVMWRDILTDESRQSFQRNQLKTLDGHDRMSVGGIIGIVFLFLLIGVVLLALANPEMAFIIIVLFLMMVTGNAP